MFFKTADESVKYYTARLNVEVDFSVVKNMKHKILLY